MNKKNKLIRTILILAVVAGVVSLLGGYWIYKNIPNPKQLSQKVYPESSLLYDNNGKILYEFFADRSRTVVPLSSIPQDLINATLAAEDANFYKHGGFDFRGMIRGLYRTIVERRLQGGSTLTQQLVKNALLTQERTVKRKIKEALLTIATEMTYSKDQIIEMYFNQTPYGGTTWGAQAAARMFFNKDVKDLDLAQAALIAGLPASPTRYSPFVYPDRAKNRQEFVLLRMKELKMISEEQYQKAKNEPLVYDTDTKNDIQAPHFVFYVRDKLIDAYGSKAVYEGGLKVHTTLNLDLQNFAQATVASEIAKLKNQKVSNGAVLVTEAKTGGVLAMVGSRDYFDKEIDGKYNVTTALRQPGSSIKPLTYATALEMGKITLASVFDDSETCFPNPPPQKPYCPTNYGGKYNGIQPARNSLGNSLNIPAVKTMKLVGVDTFLASASAMGITTFKDASNYGLSLTLGAGEVRMVDMATAYGVFATGGDYYPLDPLVSVTDKNNQVIFQHEKIPGERVLSRETAFLITNTLSDDGARSMVFGAGSLLNIKKHPEVAVKTGTTNDMRDNWTIGYTPDYVVAVWVGNNDNSRMGGIVSGTTGAAPIWNKVMSYWLADKTVKKMPLPAEIVTRQVCNLTGALPPSEGCDMKNEYFKKEYQPSASYSLKQPVLVDKTTNKQIKEGENNPNAEWQEKTVVQEAGGAWVCIDCSK